KDNPFGSHPYRVRLDGLGMESLSSASTRVGTHDVQFSPKATYFVDEWSAYDTSPRLTLHRANGSLVRTVSMETPQDTKLAAPAKGGFFRIKTPDDGVFLPATVQLPANYDPAKKYPVWLSIYGGPHMPQVK